MNSCKSLSNAVSALQVDSISIVPAPRPVKDVLSDVYLTDGTEDDEAIHHIIIEFALNVEQARAFRISQTTPWGKASLGISY
jgi:hypothetical protein